VYSFQLSGYPGSLPYSRGSTAVSVEVLLPELDVAIAGGDRDVSSLKELEIVCVVLSGGPEIDFEFDWTCASDRPGGVCRDLSSSSILDLSATSAVVIPADTLAEGRYTFTVEARDNVEGSGAQLRFATAKVHLSVFNLRLPEVTITVDAAVTPISAQGQLNVEDKVALDGVLQPLPESLTDVTLQWTTTAAGLDIDGDKQVAPLGSTSELFLLNSGYLSAGSSITFTLTATAYDIVLGDVVSSSSNVQVRVNYPPSSGSCLCEPPTGFALETDFNIICSGWKDDASPTIFYEYVARVPIEQDGYGAAGTGIGWKEFSLLPRTSRKSELRGVRMPLPEDSNGYNVTVLVLVSDDTGATTVVELAMNVQDPFLGLSEDAQDELLAKQFDENVVTALQKGDTSTALSSISNIAQANSRTAASRRRRLGEEDGSTDADAAAALLNVLEEATNSMLLNAENLVLVIQTLSDVTSLRSGFNSTDVTRIFQLELEYSKKNLGDVMTPSTGQKFIQSLGNLLTPEYLGEIVEQDFGVGGDGNSTAVTQFTLSLTAMFEDIKNNVASALLARSTNGEPSVRLVSDNGDVSLSAQKLSAADAAKESLGEFSGASFQLPTSIGSVIDGDGSVAIMVGYTRAVWPGAVNGTGSVNATELAGVSSDVNVTVLSTNTTFASGVHSLTLGRPNGETHAVHDLVEPVEIVFEVSNDEIRNTTIGNITSTLVVEAQCLYWSVNTGGWDDTGCTLISENATHVVCACTHLTDFATAFKETALSADFSAFTRVDLFTLDNILANPLPFVLLFTMYFLAALGCLMGSNLDSRVSHESDRIVNMKVRNLPFVNRPSEPACTCLINWFPARLTMAILALS
jgi:hypothetical protein